MTFLELDKSAAALVHYINNRALVRPAIMFIVAITGGISTGKSTVANVFKEAGIPVVDADLIAREGKIKVEKGPKFILINTSGCVVADSRAAGREGLEEDPERIRARRVHRVRRAEPGSPGGGYFRRCREEDETERHHTSPNPQANVQGSADVFLAGTQLYCDGAAAALRDRGHGRLLAQDYHGDMVRMGIRNLNQMNGN